MKENYRDGNAARMKSVAVPLYICLILCLIVDLFSAIWLLAAGVGSAFWLFPLLAAVADLIFVVLAFFCNFRFGYGLAVYILFALFFAGLSIGAWLNAQHSGALTLRAATVWIAVKVVAIVITSVSYAAATRSFSKHKKSAVAMLATLVIIFAGVAGVGAYSVASSGYFGQGSEWAIRPLAYEFDKATDSYKVVGVLGGRGEKVVLGGQFNGKPVTEVSAEVFSAENVKKIAFTGEINYKIADASRLDGANADLEITAERDNIDTVRRLLYGYGGQGAFELANKATPEGLDDGEVFVTFSYDEDSYRRFGGDILNTWIGKKGDVFDTAEYASRYPFFERSDVTSDEDLDWNFKNAGGFIFTGLHAEGEELEGKHIEKNYEQVKLGFERIFRLTVKDDNDEGSYAPSEEKIFSKVGGQNTSFRYITPSVASGWESSLARGGFDLGWKYEAGTTETAITGTLQNFLSRQTVSDFALHPVWTMRAPSLTVQTDLKDNAVTYGERIAFSAEGVAADGGFTLSYKWTGGGESWETDDFAIESMPFDGGGEYECEVTSASADSSLTAKTVKSVTVTVGKRGVTLVWTDGDSVNRPEGVLTYNGKDQLVGVAFAEGGVINDDDLGWEITGGGATKRGNDVVLHDAGARTVTLALTGDEAERYEIAAGGNCGFDMAKAVIAAEWTGTRSVGYDGSAHKAQAAANGVGDDGDIPLTVTYSGTRTGGGADDGCKNAGSYTATAAISGERDMGNYTLSNAAYSTQITPAAIELAWEERTFTYSGYMQYPQVNGVTGEASGEENGIKNGLSYTVVAVGTQTAIGASQALNAGEYTVTASLGNYQGNYYAGNYTVSAGAEKNFEVGKKEITALAWNSGSLTYNGAAQAPSVTSATGVLTTEQSRLVGQLNGTRQYSSNKDVNSYTVTVSLPSGLPADNYKFGSGVSVQKSYNIVKKEVRVTWSFTNTTYNGNAQTPVPSSGALCSGDSLTATISAESGSELTDGKSVNAGTYIATAAVNCLGNYTLTNSPLTYKIAPVNVALTWNVASGYGYVYDGAEHCPQATANGVNGSPLGLSYNISRNTGAGLTDGKAVNAGSYTVTASFASATDQKNYNPSNTSLNFSINKRSLDITLVYDMSSGTPHYASDGKPAISDLSDRLKYTAAGLITGHEIEITYRFGSGNIITADVIVKSGGTAVTLNYMLHINSVMFAYDERTGAEISLSRGTQVDLSGTEPIYLSGSARVNLSAEAKAFDKEGEYVL